MINKKIVSHVPALFSGFSNILFFYTKEVKYSKSHQNVSAISTQMAPSENANFAPLPVCLYQTSLLGSSERQRGIF